MITLTSIPWPFRNETTMNWTHLGFAFYKRTILGNHPCSRHYYPHSREHTKPRISTGKRKWTRVRRRALSHSGACGLPASSSQALDHIMHCFSLSLCTYLRAFHSEPLSHPVSPALGISKQQDTSFKMATRLCGLSQHLTPGRNMGHLRTQGKGTDDGFLLRC